MNMKDYNTTPTQSLVLSSTISQQKTLRFERFLVKLKVRREAKLTWHGDEVSRASKTATAANKQPATSSKS